MVTDAFDKNVIAHELKQLQQNDDNLEKNKEISLPGMAKHFLVFIATTWSSKRKSQFLVSRYGLEMIILSFLVPVIKEMAVTLAVYGWIMNTIVGDGASEN